MRGGSHSLCDLTRYAVVTQYPGASEPVTESHYRDALGSAEAVVRWAEEEIGWPSCWLRGAAPEPKGSGRILQRLSLCSFSVPQSLASVLDEGSPEQMNADSLRSIGIPFQWSGGWYTEVTSWVASADGAGSGCVHNRKRKDTWDATSPISCPRGYRRGSRSLESRGERIRRQWSAPAGCGLGQARSRGGAGSSR